MSIGAPDYAPWQGTRRTNATGGASIYAQAITIPVSTVIASPTSQDIVMAKGFITRVAVRFPPGVSALAGLAVFNGATQIWPGTASTWLTDDDSLVDWDTDLEVPLVGGQYKLTLKGYNLDDTYPHTLYVRMWVVLYP